jgi:hypothetical protein
VAVFRSAPAPFLDEAAGPLAARVRRARALASRSRRLAAALCAGAAVLTAVSALTPAPADPVPAGGGASAIASVALPAGAGAGPAGEAERVAVTVRLADAAGALLLRPGVHVEVIAGPPAGSAGTTADAGDAVVLAADAVVLVVPQPGSDAEEDAGLLAAGSATGGPGLGGVVVLSVAPADAHRLVAAAGTRPLSVTVALPEA